MAAVDIRARDVPAGQVDNLFNYEVNDDLFKDVDISMDVAPSLPATLNKGRGTFDAGLGLDEEIKVTKKRAPVAKLDEGRLLSQSGIPKLRSTAKERLKFKGRGHEYADVARLLNFYQLWLDDLYPRAKFTDGLAIIEKLGHTKRIQTMRKEWINECKTRFTPSVQVQEPPTMVGGGNSNHPHSAAHANKEPHKPHGSRERDTSLETQPSAKDLENDNEGPRRPADLVDDGLFISDDDGAANVLPEDDLDILLEDEARQGGGVFLRPEQDVNGAPLSVSFDDEEEAMAGIW
ncbi:MAG: hypothetical protein Q9217_005455 [Psora testacea]